MSPFGINREQSRELWSRIDKPVLLVSGSESWFAQESREDPLRYFQNAQHVQINDAGHWLHHDQLDEFLMITREFLASA
jgi:pimeloyl-ACP methyl ester carboxylesterase